MYKGIIFDLDGVITNTSIYHERAWTKLINDLNIDCPYEVIQSTKGVDRYSSLQKILSYAKRSYSEVELQNFLNQKNDYYLEYLEKLSKDNILPGVIELLIDLKKIGCKLAIASSSKNARFILRQLNLENYFDVIVDGFSVSKGKPHPEIFLKAANQLKLSKNSILIIEDSEVGVQAAKRSKIKVLFLGKDCELKLSKPDYSLADLKSYQECIDIIIG